MSHQDHRASDSRPAKWAEISAPSADSPDVVPLSAARARAAEEAAAAIARELNGPLTALMLGIIPDDVAGTDAERFLEESGCRWVPKPFRLRDLVRAARETLG